LPIVVFFTKIVFQKKKYLTVFNSVRYCVY
jgi:hypothetical protein